MINRTEPNGNSVYRLLQQFKNLKFGHTVYPLLSYDFHNNDYSATNLKTRALFEVGTVFRLPPRSRCDLQSSGMLRSVCWYFLTDVSGEPIGPMFKGQ